MSQKEKYKKVFIESFGINESELNDDLKYNTIDAWDSVGHMSLIALLEDTFEIQLEMDEIIDFSSYSKGMEILSNHGIKLN